MLGSPLNQSAWPRVVSQDICRHLEHLLSEAVTLRGRAQGRTLLPLPLCVERKDEHQLRYEHVHYVSITQSSFDQTFTKLVISCNICVCVCVARTPVWLTGHYCTPLRPWWFSGVNWWALCCSGTHLSSCTRGTTQAPQWSLFSGLNRKKTY